MEKPITKSLIVGEFNNTGKNTVDIEYIISQWNHLWWISEWKRDNSFRIIKYARKDSSITACKLTISDEQAKELIERLNLKPAQSGFKNGVSWRRDIDLQFLEDYRKAKRYTEFINRYKKTKVLH